MKYLPVLIPLIFLAACEVPAEPFSRPGTWTQTGVNQRNLEAMIVDPRDLQRGRSAAAERGHAATAAVERLDQGKRTPLTENRTASFGGGGGQ